MGQLLELLGSQLHSIIWGGIIGEHLGEDGRGTGIAWCGVTKHHLRKYHRGTSGEDGRAIVIPLCSLTKHHLRRYHRGTSVKLILPQLVKRFAHRTQSNGSLPSCSSSPMTPIRMNPGHHLPYHIYKINFNIITSSMPRSLKNHLPSDFLAKTVTSSFSLSYREAPLLCPPC